MTEIQTQIGQGKWIWRAEGVCVQETASEVETEMEKMVAELRRGRKE